MARMTADVTVGQSVDIRRIERSSKLVTGLAERWPDSFDSRYLHFGHHMEDCALHRALEPGVFAPLH